LRVVLDTNVLVSAVLSGRSAPATILASARRGEITIVVSPELIAELRDVLHRKKFRAYLSVEEADGFVAELQSFADEVASSDAEPGATRDPYDDYLVGLATAAKVDALVSGDDDIQSASGLQIRVLSPRELADEIRIAAEQDPGQLT
jgi:putative PIN family toxin of toxin-antitoxin system